MAKKKIGKTQLLYSGTIIFLAALSIYAYSQIRNLIDSSEWINHTNNVTLALQKISTAIVDAETNQRGFLLAGDSVMLQKRDNAFAALAAELSVLDSLTRNNPYQVRRLKHLKESINKKLESMSQVIALSVKLEVNPAMQREIHEGMIKMTQVKRNLEEMARAENRLMQERSENYLRLSFITPLFIVILFFGALLVLVVSFVRLNAALAESRVLQKKFEEEKNLAQTVLNSSPDNIVVLDHNLRCLSVNLQAERYLEGLGIEYKGKLFNDIFPGSESLSDLKKVLQGQEIHRNDFYSKNTDRHFEIHHLPLKKDGKIIGAISLSRDISPTVKMNLQLEQQNDMLEKANKELESFAYISSHDLQEPLRKIQTFVSRIEQTEKGTLSQNASDLFNRIQLAANRMQALVRDLLAFSRTSTEERNFEKQDLGKILEEVKNDLKEELAEKHAVVETGEMCEASVIPFQFRQLLHNIIGNAIKFSKPGQSPRIRIRSRVVKGAQLEEKSLEPEITYCHVQIKDDGIGFEQKYSDRIFEVFQRLHTREQSAGTGIGLAIVKKIVENHRGIIRATGEPDVGATFDIYFPAE